MSFCFSLDSDSIVVDLEEMGVDQDWGSTLLEVHDFEGELVVWQKQFL